MIGMSAWGAGWGLTAGLLFIRSTGLAAATGDPRGRGWAAGMAGDSGKPTNGTDRWRGKKKKVTPSPEPLPKITFLISTELTNAQHRYICDKNGIKMFVLCSGLHHKESFSRKPEFQEHQQTPANTIVGDSQKSSEGLYPFTG